MLCVGMRISVGTVGRWVRIAARFERIRIDPLFVWGASTVAGTHTARVVDVSGRDLSFPEAKMTVGAFGGELAFELQVDAGDAAGSNVAAILKLDETQHARLTAIEPERDVGAAAYEVAAFELAMPVAAKRRLRVRLPKLCRTASTRKQTNEQEETTLCQPRPGKHHLSFPRSIFETRRPRKSAFMRRK